MITMLFEKSSGAIIYTARESNEVEFLLLHYTSGHWDFPKGNIEVGEDELMAARREVFEETGIADVEFLEGFRRTIQYYYRRDEKLVQKEVVFRISNTNRREILLSSEHIGFAWKNYDKAISLLTFKSAKNLLLEAKEFLESNGNNS
jgi:bis(5'-nucleosidyl)-tetraphosphatase